MVDENFITKYKTPCVNNNKEPKNKDVPEKFLYIRKSVRGTICVIALLLILFILSLLFDNESFPTTFYGLTVCIIGLLFFYLVGLKSYLPFSPNSIFAIVWLGFSVIASLPLPLADRLSKVGWQAVLIVAIFFYMGSFIGLILKDLKLNDDMIKSSTLFRYLAPMLLMLISIILNLYQARIAGSFVLISGDISSFRRTFLKPWLSALTGIGTLGVWISFYSGSLKKSILLKTLAAVYIVLTALLGVRWSLFILLLGFTAKMTVSKMSIKRSIWLTFIAIIGSGIIFYVFAYLRTDIKTLKYYFGQYYSGNYTLFFLQIPLRYVSYNFTLTQRYIEYYCNGPFTNGVITFYPLIYPILKLLGYESAINIPDPISVFGYNAPAFSGLVYLDFGWLGLIIIPFLYGLISQWIYKVGLTNKNSPLALYAVGTVTILVTLSFYAYVNSFVQLLVYYPVIMIVICLFSLSTKKLEVFHSS